MGLSRKLLQSRGASDKVSLIHVGQGCPCISCSVCFRNEPACCWERIPATVKGEVTAVAWSIALKIAMRAWRIGLQFGDDDLPGLVYEKTNAGEPVIGNRKGHSQ